MLKSRELELANLKEVVFRASYIEMGDKLIIIIPKNYHKDVRKMSKPIEVVVKDLSD